MGNRKILHLDLDAFYCAVEILKNPQLADQPFAVGGRPDQRGVVASCSYPARQFGVHSAMPMSRALRLCPQLATVRGDYAAYDSASREVMARLRDMTPLVEQLSIDEAFLDVSDLPDPATELARQIQTKINTELKLPCSIGVASNKLVAKIANNIGKSEARTGRPPNAIKVVSPGQEAAFLAPLPIRELWGVGPKTAEHLAALGVHTIGDIARWPEENLAMRFGKLGRDLARRSKGLDDRPVVTEHEAKSISRETTFVRDVSDGSRLKHTLRKLSDSVGRRLRKNNLQGNTVKLKLRWSDFATLTRQTTLDQPTDLDDEIYRVALALFEANWPKGRPVRLIGVGVSGFDAEPRQLGLWEEDTATQHRLQETLDNLRQRFGRKAVQRGSDLADDEA